MYTTVITWNLICFHGQVVVRRQLISSERRPYPHKNLHRDLIFLMVDRIERKFSKQCRKVREMQCRKVRAA